MGAVVAPALVDLVPGGERLRLAEAVERVPRIFQADLQQLNEG